MKIGIELWSEFYSNDLNAWFVNNIRVIEWKHESIPRTDDLINPCVFVDAFKDVDFDNEKQDIDTLLWDVETTYWNVIGGVLIPILTLHGE